MSTRLQRATCWLANPDGITYAQAVNPSLPYSPNIALDGNYTSSPGPQTLYTVPFFIEPYDRYRFVLTCPSTGNPQGSVSLQACIDPSQSVQQAAKAAELQNWLTQTFLVNGYNPVTSQTISGATQVAFDETACNYDWVRAVITLTSGTIQPTCRFAMKGMGGR
jgi:hypothetical protein